jgi:hypothetical protein
MKSTVELDIASPQSEVAELFAEPGNNPQWMDDLQRIEPVSGPPGEPGSVYRMVPKRGSRGFDATVVSRALPTEVRLSLDSPTWSVAIRDTFLRRSDDTTHLISEEVFTFKGPFSGFVGFVAAPAIKRAHRRHMEAFKRFAESR